MTDKYAEIDAVVSYIHDHLYDPLPLARLAEYAAYSPYHFTRIFKERIGLSPQYYISSLRLQRAKDLLLRTDMTIRDIGLEVGQQSLGTFTTRFTERVGMTPSHFRHSASLADSHFRSLQRLSDWRESPGYFLSRLARVEGTVRADVPFDGFVLIGLFPKPIPEGFPLYGTLLSSLGSFCFADVQPGTYYLMATSVSWSMNVYDMLLPHTTLRTRSHDPIVVAPNRPVPPQEVTLYPPRLDDPPILISLPLLMRNFLQRVQRREVR
ncbi:AraC family transcriptional regulator [Paenibacillus sp. J31TS4]|uniref:helix-turn-helix transcriptional regulator n=1 Tax=Paenibacillus sp. J31TS4 TaxID=2807195 RepID=UPI001B01FB82|nr:helix-turn-helix transcriptional regulator [Paenibacillus sp. J31TS4]GIP41112.1 AraC family transcriptional regulator [Paenibacillus sp. J31TS4]